jgi:hypothetical protein
VPGCKAREIRGAKTNFSVRRSDAEDRNAGDGCSSAPGFGRKRASSLLCMVAAFSLFACSDDNGGLSRNNDLDCGTDAARAGCLTPMHSPEHYIEQSETYFYTMDSSVSPFVIPDYSDLVARWEWPPWLLLTGFGRDNMIWTDILLKLNPTRYAMMDCRAFPVQPFGRCHVVFDYSGDLCPIYEEFTFNDQGEITFIEAWTDLPGWLPTEAPEDAWAEGKVVRRLSSNVPGLGNETGLIDLDAPWMEEVARRDPDVADFLRRARDPYRSWLEELLEHWQDVEQGCHPAGQRGGHRS